MGLTGKTKSYSNVNAGTEGLDNSLVQYLLHSGFGQLNPGTPDINDPSLDPYRALFAQQNALNFAQAKESAGNLTGSGFANTLGSAVARSNVEQGSFLANLLEQRRQADAQRYMSLVLGTLGSPAGGRTLAYQPGFLDYASQGLGAAASAFAHMGGTSGLSLRDIGNANVR